MVKPVFYGILEQRAWQGYLSSHTLMRLLMEFSWDGCSFRCRGRGMLCSIILKSNSFVSQNARNLRARVDFVVIGHALHGFS
ncbi:hypothetical protein BRADI_2g23715v3 [Brachypodium distachyon]|uniref:Uncharacterized protein n=1 Tax=Brachypodium distachyon TaxID=15368 RepID=A0A2K2DA47_BRADI|nr:hypothetical protein BRADI_2g23715v3 [Brachypodium distachyon]